MFACAGFSHLPQLSLSCPVYGRFHANRWMGRRFYSWMGLDAPGKILRRPGRRLSNLRRMLLLPESRKSDKRTVMCLKLVRRQVCPGHVTSLVLVPVLIFSSIPPHHCTGKQPQQRYHTWNTLGLAKLHAKSGLQSLELLWECLKGRIPVISTKGSQKTRYDSATRTESADLIKESLCSLDKRMSGSERASGFYGAEIILIYLKWSGWIGACTQAKLDSCIKASAAQHSWWN